MKQPFIAMASTRIKSLAGSARIVHLAVRSELALGRSKRHTRKGELASLARPTDLLTLLRRRRPPSLRLHCGVGTVQNPLTHVSCESQQSALVAHFSSGCEHMAFGGVFVHTSPASAPASAPAASQ